MRDYLLSQGAEVHRFVGHLSKLSPDKGSPMNRYRITDLIGGQTVSLFSDNRYQAVHDAGMEETACRIEVLVYEDGDQHWETVGHHGLEKQSDEDSPILSGGGV